MTRFLDRLARRALQAPPQVRAAPPPLQAGPAPDERPWAGELPSEVSASPSVPGAPAALARSGSRELPPPAPPDPFEPLEALVRVAPPERASVAASREAMPAAEAQGAVAAAPLVPVALRGQPASAPAPQADTPWPPPAQSTPALRPHVASDAPAPARRPGDTAAVASMPPLVTQREAAAATPSAVRSSIAVAAEPDGPEAPVRAMPPLAPDRPRAQSIAPARGRRDTRQAEEQAEGAITTVQVTIGRIEIAAVAPPAAPVRVPAPGARPLSLDDYLARRSRR